MTGDLKHDSRATAPNFTVARERLKPGRTRRWMLDPALISPGTATPGGLFRLEGGRYVFAGPPQELARRRGQVSSRKVIDE